MDKGVSIVIDGMTGVGKTSLVEIITKEFNLVPYKEIFRDENDLLGKYHVEGKEWCFPMQLSFLNNRYSQYKEASLLDNAIMDRSIYSDPIFAKLYHNIGHMKPEEYLVYKSIFDTLVNSLKAPKLVICLEVSPHEAIRRIKGRGRLDEQVVHDSYWEGLHGVYSDYYANYNLAPLLRINVNDYDFVNNKQDQHDILALIRTWYKDNSPAHAKDTNSA